MGEAFFCEHGLRLDELPWGQWFSAKPGAQDRHEYKRKAGLWLDGCPYTFVEWQSGAFEVYSDLPNGYRTDLFYSNPGDLLLAVAYVIELTKCKMVS